MHTMHTMPSRGLYLLTRQLTDTEKLLRVVRAALQGGVVMVQYRDKSAAHDRRLEQASALCALCNEHRVPLIVNDDLLLAVRVGATGVHLGEHDIDIDTARAQLGANAVIGVSCYNELNRARVLALQGADYLAFGSFFESSSKPSAPRADPQLLAAARPLGLPLVAIGGINVANGASLRAAGADLLAVISAVFDADDPLASTRQMARWFDD